MNNRYAIFTSNAPRHKYFIKKICEVVDPVLILCEKKEGLDKIAKNIEQDFFNDDLIHPEAISIEKGKINKEEIAKICRDRNVDIALVFGTSLIKKNIIESVNKFLINIHTGITQSYRGVDSSFWALFNNDLENIGVTVHKVDLGIDTGDIILQERIKIEINDDENTIFMKCCQLGTDILAEKLHLIDRDLIDVKKLEKQGKLYMKRHKTVINTNFVKSVTKNRIKSYLESK